MPHDSDEREAEWLEDVDYMPRWRFVRFLLRYMKDLFRNAPCATFSERFVNIIDRCLAVDVMPGRVVVAQAQFDSMYELLEDAFFGDVDAFADEGSYLGMDQFADFVRNIRDATSKQEVREEVQELKAAMRLDPAVGRCYANDDVRFGGRAEDLKTMKTRLFRSLSVL